MTLKLQVNGILCLHKQSAEEVQQAHLINDVHNGQTSSYVGHHNRGSVDADSTTARAAQEQQWRL